MKSVKPQINNTKSVKPQNMVNQLPMCVQYIQLAAKQIRKTQLEDRDKFVYKIFTNLSMRMVGN